MRKLVGWISPSMFVLIIICFFLPFATVSCKSTEIASLSGVDLVLGKNIDGYNMAPSVFALMSLVFAVIGVFLGLLRDGKGKLISAVVGIAGFICIFLIKSDMSKVKVDSQYVKFLRVDYKIGVVLVLIIFGAAIIYNLFSFYLTRKADSPPRPR